MRSLVKSTMTLDLAEYWHAYGIQNVNQLRMAGVLLYDKMWVPAFARTTEQEHREVTQGLSLPRRWESILASSCGFPPPQERESQGSSDIHDESTLGLHLIRVRAVRDIRDRHADLFFDEGHVLEEVDVIGRPPAR